MRDSNHEGSEEKMSMIRCAQEIQYADEIRYVDMRKKTEEKEEG